MRLAAYGARVLRIQRSRQRLAKRLGEWAWNAYPSDMRLPTELSLIFMELKDTRSASAMAPPHPVSSCAPPLRPEPAARIPWKPRR